MLHIVTCMTCGKMELVEIEEGKILGDWAYFGKMRLGIGQWGKSIMKVDSVTREVTRERCNPWWRELKFRLIDLKRLIYRQYKDVELWECPECQEEEEKKRVCENSIA